MGLYERDYYQDSNELQSIGGWNGRSAISVIIIANVAIFLANFIFGGGTSDPVNRWLWLRGGDLTDPLQWYRLLGNGFAHSKDITHILFNMLSLYLIGQSVEARYGKSEFFRFYMVTIVVCSLGWLIKLRLTLPPEAVQASGLLGASGAVTGVILLFVFNFPQATLMAFGIIPIKAWVYGAFVVLMNVLGTSQYRFGQAQQVAYDVHLIGAACAAAYFYAGLSLAFMADWKRLIPFKSTKRTNLKIHRPDANQIPESMQIEADRILEKLHREGQESLTSKERKRLEEYSRAVRKSRQN